MAKLDLYKQHKAEYVAPRGPVLVDVKPAQYLTIEGRGEPGAPAFQSKLGALYNVAFTIKMTKKSARQDYAVCKLEGLWWGNKRKGDFLDEPRDLWNWKLMIRTPDLVQKRDLTEAAKTLIARGRPADVSDVKLESLSEGRCVQILHSGPYDQENRTIELMHEFAAQNRLTLHGLHHEIYLSDPRRVEPARLQTILRHPVR